MSSYLIFWHEKHEIPLPHFNVWLIHKLTILVNSDPKKEHFYNLLNLLLSEDSCKEREFEMER